MTDTPVAPPVAPEDEPLPTFLQNTTLADIEVIYILEEIDEFGGSSGESRWECSEVGGFSMQFLPMAVLKKYCLSLGLIVEDDSNRSSLLQALATKKKNSQPTLLDALKLKNKTNLNLSPFTSSEDEEQDVSNPSNQSNGTTPVERSSSNGTTPVERPLSTAEIVKSATLKDVETIQEKDTDGMDLLDDDGVKQKIATTIKGISIKDIKVDALRTAFATDPSNWFDGMR
jgi:hypothetical protein